MHILIIEGFRPAHEVLKKMGVEITLLIEEYRISGNEKNFYNRYYTVSNDAGIEEWLEKAKEIDKISHIDKVVNFHENRQYEAAKISEYLGLKYYNILETDVCKNKIFMREFLNESGIDLIQSGKLESISDYLSSGKVQFPLIIKPYDGWASKNIYKVNNMSELKKVYDLCQQDEDTLYCFEEFIDGEEFSVETFSQLCDHKIISITKKFKDEHFVETGHCVPSNIELELYHCIKNKVIDFLSGINHVNGPMHTEIIVHNNKEVHIIESHLRMGGDNIPDLINISSSFDLLSCWCEQIVAGSVNWEVVPEITKYNTDCFAVIKYFASDEDMVGSLVQNIRTERLEQVPCVKGYRFFVEKGDKIVPNKDSFSRLGYVIVNGTTYEEANRIGEQLVDLDIVEIDNNRECE
jgi:biotin carboxylase